MASDGYKEIYNEAIKWSSEATGQPIDLDKERKIKIYNQECSKNTEFFS